MISSYECAGVDGLICKLHLVATVQGVVNHPLIGMPVIIKPALSKKNFGSDRMSAISASYTDESNKVLVHEVKRVGFLIDRYVDLQVRVGDSLVLYL